MKKVILLPLLILLIFIDANKNIYAQIIDDTTSKTLVSCSTLDRDIKLNSENGRTCSASRLMGEKLAELSRKKNITNTKVVAIIGDGGLTAGMAFEALNHAGYAKSNILVILAAIDGIFSKNKEVRTTAFTASFFTTGNYS